MGECTRCEPGARTQDTSSATGHWVQAHVSERAPRAYPRVRAREVEAVACGPPGPGLPPRLGAEGGSALTSCGPRHTRGLQGLGTTLPSHRVPSTCSAGAPPRARALVAVGKLPAGKGGTEPC